VLVRSASAGVCTAVIAPGIIVARTWWVAPSSNKAIRIAPDGSDTPSTIS
jgi:hypothetical protein